jgi:hypothetical protein
MAPVDRAPLLEPPPGWSIALGAAYCPRHDLAVQVCTDNLLHMPAPLLRGEH